MKSLLATHLRALLELNPRVKLASYRSGLDALLREMNYAEGGVITFGLAIWYAAAGSIAVAASFAVIAILSHLYPVMLQRRNRGRVLRLVRRLRARSGRALCYLLTVLVFTACGPRNEAGRVSRDDALSRALVGNWIIEKSNVVGVLTFQADNSYSGYWSNELTPKGWRFDGEWKIVDGAFVAKVTRASYWNYTNKIVLGQETSTKIVHLNEQELILEDPAEIKWRRNK